MELTIFHRLGIALGLGLIVGFQREWAAKQIAGVRTFPLITIFGTLCGEASKEYGAWIPAVGLAGVAGFLLMGNVIRAKTTTPDAGITTEVSALIMFVVGVVLAVGEVAVGVVVAGVVAVLLQWKRPMHELTRKVGEEDLQAVFRLVLVGLVILPALPDQAYGPYDVLNPFRIWMMVVLIVGISLAAYMAYKLFGEGAGSFLSGLLGGLISSTATTVTASRRARRHPGAAGMSAAVILIASTVVFGRVLFEIAVVAMDILPETAPPLGAMMGLMALLAVVTFAMSRREETGSIDEPDPPDLKTAIVFGLLYMFVLLGVAVAKDFFGESGLYFAAGLSGLTDMDAITLSTAQLVKAGELETSTAWRVILVGAMANLVFKGGVTAALGHWRLFIRVMSAFAVAIVGGIALIFLWPA